ncbi:MAG: hypothetical protein VX529_06850 [Pseudomonadota bacterium]|nr:hypothetical protein [Pseudomonadota bacterium]
MRNAIQALLATALFAGAAGAEDYEGVWDTSFGEVRIQERAGAFCGEYDDVGFVAGYTNGHFARGVFVHADQGNGALDDKRNNRGIFQWIQNADGAFDGHWLWGTQVQMSRAQPWNGQRTRETRPSGSQWRRNAGYCLGYLSGLPEAAHDWMRAARDMEPPARPAPAPAPQPPAPQPQPEPESPARLPVPGHVDTSNFTDCEMSTANANILICTMPTGRRERRALDLSLCQDGSVEPAPWSNAIICAARDVAGSYSRSCDRMSVSGSPVGDAAPRTTRNSYVTECAGPAMSMLGEGTSRTLVSTENRVVFFMRQRDDRRYRNFYRASACESRQFWNENGYLRCSGN